MMDNDETNNVKNVSPKYDDDNKTENTKSMGKRWHPLISFAEETTTNGLMFIIRSRGPVKLVSMIVCAVFFIVTVVTVIQNIRKYQEDPRGTLITQKIEIATKHAPTVFFCPSSRIDKTLLNAELQRFYEENDFINRNQNNTNKIRLKKLQEVYGNMIYKDFLTKYGSLQESSLKNSICLIGTELMLSDRGCITDVELVLTERGVCYQMNANKNIPLEGGHLGAVSFFTMLDPSRSLKTSLEYGFEVFIKDHGSLLNRFDINYVLSPGHIHTLKVSVEEVHSMAWRQNERVCFDIEDPGVYYPRRFYGSPAMSADSCYASHAIAYLNATRGCIDVPNLQSHDMKHCTLSDLKSFMVYSSDIPVTSREKELINEDFELGTPSGCVPPCTLKTYSYDIHSNLMEDHMYDFFSTRLNTTVKTLRETLIVIKILFPDIKSDVTEIKTYPLSNLLGDVGGVFGLFLGFSVFTFLEYIYFAVFYLVRKLSGGRVRGEWLVESEQIYSKGMTLC